MIPTLILAAALSTPTLAPTGKWTVEYAQSMCVLSRDYGVAGKRLTVGLRPYPMGTLTEVVLATNQDAAQIIKGKAALTLLPSGSPVSGDYARYRLPKTDVRLATLTMGQDALAGIRTAAAINLRLGARESYTLAIPAIEAGMKALEVCQADLLRTWGIDPAERGEVVTPPKGNPAAYFGPDQYPSAALRAGEQGRVIAVALVDKDGSVKSCAVADTSGSSTLDDVTCSILRRRGHFSPGRDRNGAAVVAHIVVPVRWMSPEE